MSLLTFSKDEEICSELLGKLEWVSSLASPARSREEKKKVDVTAGQDERAQSEEGGLAASPRPDM